MATNFPTSLDSLTNPATTDQLNSPSHAAQHANANDAIEKLQAKVGVDGSTVTTSHAYKIAQLESDIQNSLGDYIPLSVLGEPDGVAKLDADGNLIVPENKIIIEGATANAHELTIQAPDVTSDITVTLPNFSGTLATTVDVSNLGTLKSNTTNPSFVINGSPTVFEPSWSAATFTGSSGLVVITSTQIASYASNHFAGDEIQFNFGSGSPWFNANGTYTIISHFTSGGSQEYFYLSEFNFIPQSGYETTSYAGPSSIWFNVYPDSKNISSTEIGYLDGVTSGIQNQINLKSNIDSPTFTGTPLAPTAIAATNTTQIATTAFVTTAVNNLVNSAPATLDTLNELATALGNDANFATTTATSIGNKVSKAGGDTITSSTASTVSLVLKGAASQTANLQQWENSAGTVLSKITASGALDVTAITVNGAALAGYSAPTIGSTSIESGATVTTLAGLTSVSSTSFVGALTGNASTVTNGVYTNAANIITAASSTTIPIIAKAAASQTANLQEWQNSSGTVLAKVTATGMLDITPASGDTINFRNSSGGLTLWGGNSRYYMNTELQMNGGNWASGRLGVDTAGTGNIGIVVRGVASQTANLMEFQNSSGVPVTFFNASGGLTATEGVISTAYSGGKMTTGTLGYFNATTFNAAVSPIVVRGAASQTADLQQWQNSAGTVLTKIHSGGDVTLSTGRLMIVQDLGAQATIWSGSASRTALFVGGSTSAPSAVIRAQVSQTANLQEWQNDAGTVLSKVDAFGAMFTTTAAANTNTTQVATTAYVQTELADLVNSAPATLDTLKELSDALGADANFATTVTNNLALKAPLASPALTGTPTAPTAAVGTDSTQVATTAFVIDQIDASTQPGALYQTTAPTSPEIGQIWIDSDDNVTVFDSNIIRRQPFTATAGQTNFVTTVPFIDGFEQVYFNGLLLLKTTDYTTSGTNTVILGSAAAVNDIIEVVTITNLNSVNTYTQAETDALLAANTSVAPLSISANTNLLAKKRYFVTSASALTLTLPASPALNDEIQILDASGNASTYNITVARNGRLINGNAGNLIIDNNGGWYTLVYTGATYGWKVG